MFDDVHDDVACIDFHCVNVEKLNFSIVSGPVLLSIVVFNLRIKSLGPEERT